VGTGGDLNLSYLKIQIRRASGESSGKFWMQPKTILTVWLLSALSIGGSGAIGTIPAPAIQGIILVLSVGSFAGYFFVAKIRNDVNAIFPRGILAFHLVRFVGIYFLALYSQGKLPRSWAVPAGCGDIVIASFALMLLMVPELGEDRRWIAVWNTLGLADILSVVGTAAWLNINFPGQLSELTHLPLVLLPLFVVPIVISTHVITFYLLASKPAA